VIRIPPVASECGEEPTWEQVATCASKFGTVKVERTLPHARLIAIQDENAAARGFYLFVEVHGAWRLGGMYEMPGEALALESVRLGTHDVYRFEVGVTEREELSLDGRTPERAVILHHDQIYCTGIGYRCSSLTSACDVLIAGKSLLTFRGKVSWKAGALHVAGDRSHAGDMCEQNEVVPLSFPDDTE
jgi:hypothetical protein